MQIVISCRPTDWWKVVATAAAACLLPIQARRIVFLFSREVAYTVGFACQPIVSIMATFAAIDKTNYNLSTLVDIKPNVVSRLEPGVACRGDDFTCKPGPFHPRKYIWPARVRLRGATDHPPFANLRNHFWPYTRKARLPVYHPPPEIKGNFVNSFLIYQDV